MWTHSRVFWITESYCQSTVGTARDRLGMAPHHSWAGVGQGGASKSTSDGDEGEGDLRYCRALEKDDLWWWWTGLRGRSFLLYRLAFISELRWGAGIEEALCLPRDTGR